MTTVGVLALQGAFLKHIEMLKSLGILTLEVRKPEDLEKCDALIIPGGESTTILRQMNFIHLTDKISEFGKKKPLFGTCAGLILMSDEIIDSAMKPFRFIDVKVERNAFGRQVDSFKTDVDLLLNPKKTETFPAIFIRAPKIISYGPETQVLATFKDEAVFVRQGIHLGSTFHPELTNDKAIHLYFINLIKNL